MQIPSVFTHILFPILFLFGTACLNVLSGAQSAWGKYKLRQFLWKLKKRFFFRFFLQRFFTKNAAENFYVSLSFTKQLLYLLFAGSSLLYVLHTYFSHPSPPSFTTYFVLSFIGIIATSFFINFFFRFIASASPAGFTNFFAFFASIYLTIFFFPLWPFLKLYHAISYQKVSTNPYFFKDQIQEMLKESEFHVKLDSSDMKFLTSFIVFKNRVAKEIMIPRIDIAALSAKTSLKDSIGLFKEEGYSRIPVYQETLDHIIGVLLFKDVLKVVSESVEQNLPSLLEEPIESLLKPVVYAPENKKVAQLLQEFRAKQLHMAIVVDEYGGTEGIVTIEDILEELVGEIEDEYDLESDRQYWKLPNGDWVVDAKMSIIDLESNLNIHIPPHADYETIGGYIFHRAGNIPSKGWTIHHDDFTLEVLNTSDRAIEKIRITPRETSDEELLEK